MQALVVGLGTVKSSARGVETLPAGLKILKDMDHTTLRNETIIGYWRLFDPFLEENEKFCDLALKQFHHQYYLGACDIELLEKLSKAQLIYRPVSDNWKDLIGAVPRSFLDGLSCV